MSLREKTPIYFVWNCRYPLNFDPFHYRISVLFCIFQKVNTIFSYTIFTTTKYSYWDSFSLNFFVYICVTCVEKSINISLSLYLSCCNFSLICFHRRQSIMEVSSRQQQTVLQQIHERNHWSGRFSVCRPMFTQPNRLDVHHRPRIFVRYRVMIIYCLMQITYIHKKLFLKQYTCVKKPKSIIQ